MGIKQAKQAILGCMKSAVQREDRLRIDVQACLQMFSLKDSYVVG